MLVMLYAGAVAEIRGDGRPGSGQHVRTMDPSATAALHCSQLAVHHATDHAESAFHNMICVSDRYVDNVLQLELFGKVLLATRRL